MPLRKLSAKEMSRALRIPGATQWGKGSSSAEPGPHPMNASRRLHQSRLPLWHPGDAPTISRGATVFTMGSCFAREIENSLDRAGFRIASFIDGRTDGLRDSSIANRFNAPSMALEFRRLLEGPACLPDEALVAPVGEGRYLDTHYHGSAEMTLPELAARRQRFHADLQGLRTADVVILTLGLNEAAYDLDWNLYRNGSPTVSEIRQGRPVELHSFSTHENIEHLEAIHDLVTRLCPRSPTIFVTVSPVPLAVTYQREDVIVANSEGKAILRAAVAEFCALHPDVVYFPSYEMALNADFAAVFKGDKRHLHKPYIRSIVAEFLRRHCPSTASSETDDVALAAS